MSNYRVLSMMAFGCEDGMCSSVVLKIVVCSRFATGIIK